MIHRIAFILGLCFAIRAEAQITYGGNGTGTGVTATTCTPGVPGSLTSTSVSIAVLHSRTDTAHTCTAACTGWTEFSTQAGDATGGRVSVWWYRGTYGTAPTFGGPATESYACRIWWFAGVITTGNPWDLLGTNTTRASASSYTGASLTPTTVDNVMLVFVGGSMDNNTWGTASGGIDTPAGADANFYVNNNAGTDNSIFLAYDTGPANTAPATLTAPTHAMSTLGPDAGRTFEFALKPEPVTCVESNMSKWFGCY